MFQTLRAARGIVTAPHHLAAQAGLAVLREGGNAIEAMVAAAAVTGVVYPHMAGLGGDGFWLVRAPGEAPRAILACGRAAEALDLDFYKTRGIAPIPARGPLAAITVAGNVSGWQSALDLSARLGGRMPLARLLEDAIHYARDGYAVTETQVRNTAAKRREIESVAGFADLFLPGGQVPAEGSRFKNPALAESLSRLAVVGLDDFYRGELARRIAAELARVGSPLALGDLAAHRAAEESPLALRLRVGTVYNTPAPTQGLASLVILGVFDRLGVKDAEGFAHIHGVVEATKFGFHLRDTALTDPAYMRGDPQAWLGDAALGDMARRIDFAKAGPWTLNPAPGDTVWMGAIDRNGLAVSFIHSIYWEFGSGVTLRDTGIVWQNRGMAFSLKPGSLHELRPRRLPFHTNNPALAVLDDGRVLVYGAMGGDGQPQTQAALFTRYAIFGQPLQQAVTAPRWVLGRTWGAASAMGLRIERRFDDATVTALRKAGHNVELVEPFTDVMGHAGAVVRRADGIIEGASDPRSDGVVAAY
ncbi:MAG TPA: gamma-glutamyltransferase family protein [Alphaproteobacteria bacterium]|nr:gamma-glutamyltransferase family protein [Alphaproteobacteria bacterium]